MQSQFMLRQLQNCLVRRNEKLEVSSLGPEKLEVDRLSGSKLKHMQASRTFKGRDFFEARTDGYEVVISKPGHLMFLIFL